MRDNNWPFEPWVTWTGGLVAATAALTFTLLTYAYANFQTKDNAQLMQEQMNRIEADAKATRDITLRMDGKVDQILKESRQ